MGEYAEYGFDQQGWYGMFFACGIWCLADVSGVSPSSEQTLSLALAVSNQRVTEYYLTKKRSTFQVAEFQKKRTCTRTKTEIPIREPPFFPKRNQPQWNYWVTV